MRTTVALRFGTCLLAVLGASVVSYGRSVSIDYSHKSVTELIDDLTQVESESVAINSNSVHVGFIADETPVSLRTNVVGVVVPDAPPQVRELVRRGPLALPELIKHLDDIRPTKLRVGDTPPGSSGVFYGKVFCYEYDPRVRGSDPPIGRFRCTQQHFASTYTVRVGDVCYALIGQIVNRRLLAVRVQPTGFLFVNSPIEAPVLIEKVKSDWRSGDAETVKASLLADIHGASDPMQINEAVYTEIVVNPALQRMRLYFPDAYNALAGGDLTRKLEFEKQNSARKRVSGR